MILYIAMKGPTMMKEPKIFQSNILPPSMFAPAFFIRLEIWNNQIILSYDSKISTSSPILGTKLQILFGTSFNFPESKPIETI